MAPSAVAPPPHSALQNLQVSSSSDVASSHPLHLQNLATSILFNLQHQHDWTSLTKHTHSTMNDTLLPRPLLSGLPPTRAYVHPDEQAEILKAEYDSGKKIPQVPEREWVLPTHIKESFSLKQFAAIFDSIETVPRPHGILVDEEQKENNEVGANWRGSNRQKRVLLATLHDDSTVVYYIVHDGIVKPRQN